ncbi:MAG: hypothetical protein FWC23_09195 [Chitinispirillia bacterium]|nr:hypothetical protein [Chitinispirillia bacterium]MCL2269344.1 hypothetical protein [Chitinispirillia bacterium]
MHRFSFKYAVSFTFALVLAILPAGAADLLVNDFTDAGASHLQGWRNSAAPGMTVDMGSGGASINNTNGYLGEYRYQFDGAKPATFTISYVLRSQQGPDDNAHAGVMFCRGSGEIPTGYVLTLLDGRVSVLKYVAVATNQYSWTPIFYHTSFDLKASDNKLTVSKSGSELHIFANDVFQGKITDSQYASGDVSLALSPGASGVFGAFSMTDEFKPGEAKGSFSDNFNGNGLKYWKSLNYGGPASQVTEDDGMMKMQVPEGTVAVRYADLDLPGAFSVSVEARHISGATNNMYGIILIGESGEYVPTMNFGITGVSGYAVWDYISNTYIPASSNAIKGSGVSFGSVFIDTLEIKRSSGASEIEFFANGKPLAHSGVLPAGFKIVGVGLFAYSDKGEMAVAFDNFSAANEVAASIKFRPAVSRRPAALKGTNNIYYDVLGRARYSTSVNPGRLPAKARAAGVYVNENGRDVRVRRDRR